MERELRTEDDLVKAVEALFPYCGHFNRSHIDLPWQNGARVIAETLALKAKAGVGAEARLLQAMYEAFVQAKRTLGNRRDVGIMWRRQPHIVTDDSGDIVLRLRVAFVDGEGTIKVHGLPFKAEGSPSRSID